MPSIWRLFAYLGYADKEFHSNLSHVTGKYSIIHSFRWRETAMAAVAGQRAGEQEPEGGSYLPHPQGQLPDPPWGMQVKDG